MRRLAGREQTTAFKVGETWNLTPDSEEMKVHLEPAGDHANLTIIVSLSKSAASEIAALTKEPFNILELRNLMT